MEGSLMGIGSGSGENRAVEAAKMAISSPLLEVSIDGAHGILFTVTGGPDLTMTEVSEAAKIITSSAAEDAKIIFGAIIDESLSGSIRLTVVATGFDDRRLPTVKSEEGGAAGKYLPSAFVRKTQKEEAEESKRFKNFTTQKQPLSTGLGSPLPGNSAAVADEELEIPAFIRRKMGI